MTAAAVRRAGVAAVAALAGLAGCSGTPPMVEVTGVVTLDGKPAGGCQIAFFPADSEADPLKAGYGVAVADADGRYVLTNALGDGGVFPGTYKVTICLYTDKTGATLPATAKPSEVPGGAFNVMPKKLEDPRLSDETVTVGRGRLEKNFAVTGRVPPRR